MKSQSTKILTYACFLFCLIAISRSVIAAPLDITFENSQGLAPNDIFTYVYLDGDIDSNSPARLNNLLSRIPPKSAVTFSLNSNGGNLFAGIELGRIIRKLGASTTIAKKGGRRLNDNEEARCYSACALVFLGGIYRFQNDKTIYGVHRISNSTGPTSQDLDIGQILSAAISTYIAEMGVDEKLFKILANTDSNEMYILSNKEMKELRVANNGRRPAEWEVKIIPGSYYLRGQQETYFGFGKIVLACESKKIILMSFYSAGEKKAAEIAAGGWIHKLSVDNNEFPLPQPNKNNLIANGGMINSSFRLTDEHIKIISKAEKIGHSMQPSPNSSFFLGYDIDIDAGDLPKVRDYIQNCK